MALVSAVLDSLLGIMLFFIAVSIGLGSIVGSVYVNIAVSPQAGSMLGNSVARTVIFHISNGSTIVPADELMSLADSSPLPCSFLSLRSQLGLSNLTFRVDVMPSLNVAVNVTGSGLVVDITKTGQTDPVQAFLRLYVVDVSAQSVAEYAGESSVDGSGFFSVTLTNTQVGVVLAKAGSAVGYATFTPQGIPLNQGSIYLMADGLHGGNQTSVYVLSFEDWTGPVPAGGNVNVSAYSLPVMLLYEGSGGAVNYSTYPWFGGCGPTPVQVVGSYVSDQVFLIRTEGGVVLLRVQVWGTGGA